MLGAALTCAMLMSAGIGDSLPSLVLDVVNDNIPGSIVAKKTRFEAPSTAIFEDTILKGPDGATIAAVARLKATVAVSNLLVGDLVVSDLVIDEPLLDLKMQDGHLNLERAFVVPGGKKDDGESSSTEIRIEKVRVNRASVNYKDPGTIEAEARRISGGGRVEIYTKTGTVFVTGTASHIDRGKVTLPDLDIPFSDVDVTGFRLRTTNLAVDGLSARAAGARVTGKVRVKLGGSGDLDVDLHIVAPPGAWPGRLEPLPFALPRVVADTKVTGSFDSPVVNAGGSFQPFAAYKVPLGAGSFDVKVTKEQVTIRKVKVALGTQGTATATGSFVLDSKRASIDATLDTVPIGLIAGPANLSPAPRGTAYGPVEIRGVLDGQAPIDINTTLQVYSLRAYDLTPPSPTRIKAHVVARTDDVEIKSSRVWGDGLEATAKGKVFLKQERVSLTVNAEVQQPGALVSAIPAELAVGQTRFNGRVSGPFSLVRAEGDASIARVDAYGVPITDLTAVIDADAKRALVQDLEATTAEGPTTGWVRVGLGPQGALEGEVHVVRAHLDQVVFEGAEDVGLKGYANIDARLQHLVESPLIKAQVVASSVEAKKEQVGAVRAVAWITPRYVRVATLVVDGPIGRIDNRGEIAIDLEAQQIAGKLAVKRLSLEAIGATAEQRLKGTARGPVTLSGALSATDVHAQLRVEGLEAQAIPLGDGPVDVRFVPDARAPADAPEHLVLVSTDLVGPRGRLNARAGLALEREVINAEAHLARVDLAPWLELAGRDAEGKLYLPWQGEAELTATAVGAIDDPVVNAHVFIPEFASPAPSVSAPVSGAVHRFSNEVRQWDTRGPVRVDLTLSEGELEAIVCAFPAFDGTADAMSVCERNERVWADVAGPVDFETGAFDLTALFGATEPRVQTFAAALADAGLGVSTTAQGNVHVMRASSEAEPEVAGSVVVDQLVITSPDTAPVVLREPREIEVSRSGAIFFNLPPGADHLKERAPLRFLTGESALEVTGSDRGAINLKTGRLALDVNGNVALALIKPFTEEVQAAGGEVAANLQLRGTTEQPEVVGEIAPKPGAYVTPRALGRRVELTGGRVTMRLVEDNSDLIEVAIDPEGDTLELVLDDGRAALEGSVVLDKERGQVARWDLHGFGSGLFFRLRRGYVETAFDVAMVMEPAPEQEAGELVLQPTLRGRLEVNDGQVKETFELKNFVITKEGSARPSKPLREVLKGVALENLALDLDVVVHNFDARANLATFRADGALRGEVSIDGYAVAPTVSGGVEVVDGVIQFPYARFEVMQTQVTFPPAKDGRINPDIFLSARGELEPPRNGLDTEVPVLLSLDGNLDQMALKLEAEATEYNFTEGALLRYVLLGTQLSADGVVTDYDAALRAVSSELTAAFSRDLEQAIADQLGAQLSFSVFYEDGQLKGGVRYQLGERVEFDGEAAFANVGGASGSNGGSVTEARVRLLLVDHMPYMLGRDLAFEGHVTTGDGVTTQASTNLRLSYRFFEF